MLERKAFLTNPKHQDCLSQCGEHDCSANNKKNRDYYEYLSLSHSQINFDYREIGGKKFFLEIQSINIVHPNKEKIIACLRQKEWRLLCISKFVSFHEWTLITRKMVENKAFLANPKH